MRKHYLTLFAVAVSIMACQGPAGPAGSMGLMGTPGKDGQMGIPGKDGEMGLPGKDGEMGIPGMDGMDAQEFDAVMNLAVKLDPYEASVLDIECPGVDPDNNNAAVVWICSGAKISGGRILTAAHCFDPTLMIQQCTVWNATQQVGVMPTLVFSQPAIQGISQDVAVVTGVSWNQVGAALREVPYNSGWQATAGSLVALMSFPANLRNWVQYTFGHVVNPRVPVGSAYLDAATVDYVAAGGSSGGPVFNADAEIIGVHVLGRTDGLDLGWYNAVRIP